MVPSTSMDITAVGPVIKYDDEPNKKYGNRPTKALYSPKTGGRPATVAYDMACGTAINPTVTPATISFKNSFFTLYVSQYLGGHGIS